MNQEGITEKLQKTLGDRALAWTDSCGQHAVTVGPEDLIEVATFLREDPELSMNMLMDVGGVDYLDYGDDRAWRFEVAYQFYSLGENHRYRVKVAVADEKVAVPTLAAMWRVANWMEREVYDQYGVIFDGHKHLVRILNHQDFEGHPLRKDYPINKRQKLARPIENLFPEDPEWA